MENFRLEDLAHILIGLGVFVAVSMLLDDNARRARTIWAFVMSRLPSPPDGEMVPEVVHVPVAATGSSEVVPIAPLGQMPDTTAVEPGTEAWELPRVSRYL